MKNILVLIISLNTLAAFGQKKKAVDLQWKIDKNEKLNYATVMSEIDTSTFEMDFGSLFESLSDSSETGFLESKDFFNKFNKAFANLDYVSTLSTEKEGVIDLVMTTRPTEPLSEVVTDSTEGDEGEILKMMQAATQGVMLRGSVYENGGIHSFWVKSSQKNLISLLFELPKQPVKIGDKWPLEINLITNDQNFKCDSSYKLNEVTLTDIKKVDGETIAVLKYDIEEYVIGDFNSPSFFGGEGESQETMLKFTHQGIAEFSIDRGRWVSYDAIMVLNATGVMTANKSTKFTLIAE